jgi:hypothetical protein
MTTTKMENVRDNPRAVLEILDESESESDNESIFSGDSNNYEPQENQDSDENKEPDGEQSVSVEDTDDEHPSTDVCQASEDIVPSLEELESNT